MVGHSGRCAAIRGASTGLGPACAGLGAPAPSSGPTRLSVLSSRSVLFSQSVLSSRSVLSGSSAGGLRPRGAEHPARYWVFVPIISRLATSAGGPGAEDRRINSGIMDVLKTDRRWCDCPPEHGFHSTIYDRFAPGRTQAVRAAVQRVGPASTRAREAEDQLHPRQGAPRGFGPKS